MSLQVWLPLNGNLENLGLTNSIIINNGATIDNNGKIGKCYNFTGETFLTLSTGIDTTKNYSICYWFKELENNTISQFRVVYQCGNLIVGQYGKSLDIYNASGGGFDVTASLDTTVWHHACFTFQEQNSQVSIYIDGILAKQNTVTSIPIFGTTGLIGKRSTNTYLFQGLLNDFRIYDHCLSPKEVKEISKGLVLHYTLDNSGCGKNNLIKNSISAPNSFYDYTGKATASRIPSDGKVATNIYAINFPVDSATYSNYNLYCSFTRDESAVQKDGKTYTLSFKIKASKPLNNYSILYEYTNASISTNITTSWQTIRLTGVATGTYSALYLCRGVNNRSQINGNVLYIADLKLEEGSVGTAWCPHKDDPLYSILGYDSNIEPDCSGLGNDGIKTSNITISTNTPRHTTSLDFTTTDYINCGRGAMVKDALTTNIWCYMDTWAVDTHPWSCTEGGGWNWESGSGKIRFPIYITGIGYKYTNSTKGWADLSSGWHMFSATYDGMVIKTYIDGELDTTTQAATTKTTIGYNSTNSLFIHAEATGSATTPSTGYKACKMSDARVYATALSEEDIKELYNTAAMIDNGNNTYAYDFIE